MRRLEKRLRKLEDRADARGASPAKLEEARQQRALEEALSRLPLEFVCVLDEFFEAVEHGENPDTLVDSYEVADERSRRALGRWTIGWRSSRTQNGRSSP